MSDEKKTGAQRSSDGQPKGPTPQNIRVLAWVETRDGRVGQIVAATAGQPFTAKQGTASAPPGEPKAVVNEKTTWHERFGNRWFEVVDHNEEVQAHCGRRETAQFLADSLNETDLTQRRASAKPEIEEYEGEDKIINTIARLTGKPGGASYEEVQSMRAMLRGRGTR